MCIHSQVNLHVRFSKLSFLLLASIYQTRYSLLLHLTKTTTSLYISTPALCVLFLYLSSKKQQSQSSMALSRAMLVSIFSLALVASSMAQGPTSSPPMSIAMPPTTAAAPPTTTSPPPTMTPPPMMSTPPSMSPTMTPMSPGPSTSSPTSPMTPMSPGPSTSSPPSPTPPTSSPPPSTPPTSSPPPSTPPTSSPPPSTPPTSSPSPSTPTTSSPPPSPGSGAFVHGSSMALLALLGGVELLFA
ncbi:hypothetical protein ACOSQ2_025695 [Xanthoceras sorbifolium]